MGTTADVDGAEGARARTGGADTRWPARSFVADLAPAPRQALLRLGTLRQYGPHDALVLQGHLDDEVYLLAKGYVRVVGDTASGRTVLLALRTRGDLVGELAALDEGPRSASVLAATPVLARSISRYEFLRFLRAHPDAAEAVQRSVTRKLRMATRHRMETGSAPVLVRICGILEGLVATYGRRTDQGVQLDVPLSQLDLAMLAGASLPSVQRAAADLRRRGILSTGYLRLVVHDLDALRALAHTAGGEN
ncbi:Crp/Fnr family transcriptional regulator [Streptomyces sp. NPDC012600]|uniref:Crp/Fnr family transcriptional regulator n=1 Tax=Streptomyces stephensoniae TaxID=3375367 RepID=A0ABU2W9K1_9ACTN|nr:Crp/Fnr family transcriptional regulator [Streptomyces griseus]MDT0494170.1 Crp/Fnr family transcriptional regulator [Streptomyces griseus]